jgi:uncharacterized membrane protein
MTIERPRRADTIVAHVLRWGAYCAFAVMLIGLASTLFVSARTAAIIETVGVLVMMSTPVLRVAVTIVLFFREHDWKYTAISAGVLIILLLGSVFGVGEH